MDSRKQNLLACLYGFIKQRPGMDPRNYSDWRSYLNESASVTRDLRHARELLRYVELHDAITADRIIAAQRAFSGRLSIKEPMPGGCFVIEYCTGQYFPTEYRKAVCAVLAQAVWDWARDTRMPEGRDAFRDVDGLMPGDWLRRFGRRELGRGIAGRYFL